MRVDVDRPLLSVSLSDSDPAAKYTRRGRLVHVLYNYSRSPPKAFIVRPWLRQVLSWPPTSLSVDRPFVSLEEEEHSFFLPLLGFFRDPKGKEKMFLCRAELLPSAGSSSVFFLCSFLFRRAIVIAWRRWGSFLFPLFPVLLAGLSS